MEPWFFDKFRHHHRETFMQNAHQIPKKSGMTLPAIRVRIGSNPDWAPYQKAELESEVEKRVAQVGKK